MKKTVGIIFTTMLFTVLWVCGVQASVDMGGSVAMDFYYYKQDKAGFGGGRTAGSGTPCTGGFAGINGSWPTVEEDRSATFIDFSKTSTIWMRWMSEGGHGLYVMPVLAGDATQSSGTSSLNVAFVSAFGWYRVTPSFTVAAGKGMPDIFSPMDPGTLMGYDAIGKVTGLGYGNINSKYQNGLKLAYTFNKMVKIELGIFESRITDPNNASYTSVGPYIGFKKSSAAAVVDNVTKIPKFEIAVPLTFGKTKIVPSAMWSRQDFDNIVDGADSSITSWGTSLAGETQIWIFQFKGEFNYGQNWLNTSKVNVSTSFPFKSEYISSLAWAQSAMADASGRIYDSKDLAFWLQAGLTLGRFKPAVIYGYQTAKRDIPTREADVKTQMYGIVCPVTITKNLTVTPEVMVYDNGGSNKFVHMYRYGATGYGLSDTYDCGKELVAGVQVRWTF